MWVFQLSVRIKWKPIPWTRCYLIMFDHPLVGHGFLVWPGGLWEILGCLRANNQNNPDNIYSFLQWSNTPSLPLFSQNHINSLFNISYSVNILMRFQKRIYTRVCWSYHIITKEVVMHLKLSAAKDDRQNRTVTTITEKRWWRRRRSFSFSEPRH